MSADDQIPNNTARDGDAKKMLAAQRAANMAEAGDYKLSMGVIMQGMVSTEPTHESVAQPGSDQTHQHEQSIWRYMAETAHKHYEPGRFTTFVGYEWSATPNAANLHRCVIFRGDDVPDSPLSYIDTQNPEELWDWMQGPGGGPENALAIPHNSNMSQGLTFLPRYIDGRPIDRAYAEIRSLMEPLVEIHQIKGNSETSPALAMNDEFADFEQIHGGTAWGSKEVSTTAYVRDGLKEGLRQADRLGVNPFKYGFVGSTDTHTGLPGDTEEPDWGGHFPHQDTSPEARLQSASEEVISFVEENPGGLAGVWAEENSRDGIFSALRRRETFGTSGVRIKPRFFGGWSFTAADASDPSFVELGYEKGAAMGGDLSPRPSGARPSFIVWAPKDALSGNLDRIQIVKGWSDRGEVFERIYDVAWSGDRRPGPSGKVPAVGSTVDLQAATYTNDIGAVDLSGFWVDEDFDPSLRAFYYLRVLEIPTPRWSTYDAHRLGIEPPQPATVQERAWSSPIWYAPSEADRASGQAGRATAVTVADLEARGIRPLDDAALRAAVVGKVLTVRNVVTGDEGVVHFGKDGVRTVNIPPHQIIRGEYKITDGALHHMSLCGVAVSLRFFEVDGGLLAARDDHGGHVNFEVTSG